MEVKLSDEALAKLRWAVEPRLTRDYRVVTLGEHDCRTILAMVDARAAVEANRAEAVRSCTCHPSDNPPNPCAKKYALTDCKATQPESGGQGEARCAECGARLEDVRPGKHQHPTCSQHPQPSAAVTAAFDDVLRLLRPTPDVSGGAEQYGFMRGVEAARGAIKKAALAQGGKP